LLIFSFLTPAPKGKKLKISSFLTIRSELRYQTLNPAKKTQKQLAVSLAVLQAKIVLSY